MAQLIFYCVACNHSYRKEGPEGMEIECETLGCDAVLKSRTVGKKQVVTDEPVADTRTRDQVDLDWALNCRAAALAGDKKAISSLASAEALISQLSDEGGNNKIAPATPEEMRRRLYALLTVKPIWQRMPDHIKNGND